MPDGAAAAVAVPSRSTTLLLVNDRPGASVLASRGVDDIFSREAGSGRVVARDQLAEQLSPPMMMRRMVD